MQSKSFLLFHIALLPVYITLAAYLNLIQIPEPVQANLSSLLRFAKTNAIQQRLRSSLSSASLFSTSTSVPSNMPSTMKFIPRRSEERGNADHGWLKTFHTFSFASYQDRSHEQYGALRVMNEDRVEPRTGFGTHSHREFEIFSYVVSGELEHKDSMGNTEILKRGTLQLTSAGTGISHSEKAHGPTPVHFLQIWSLPSTPRLQPKYFTREFTDAEKTNTWVPVVAPVGSQGVSLERDAKGPAPVQSPLTLYATLLEKGKQLDKPIRGKKGYVHVVQTSGYNPGKATGATVKVAGGGEEITLKEGDGVYLSVAQAGGVTVENSGDLTAEILLFDLE